MKTKIVAVLCAAFLASCGARKTEKEQTHVKSEKVSETEEKEVVKTESNLTIDYDVINKRFTVKPVDNSKPMTVNGNTYENAILSEEIEKNNTKLRHEDIKSLERFKTSIANDSLEINAKKKDTDRKESKLPMLATLIILVVFVLFLIHIRTKKTPLI